MDRIYLAEPFVPATRLTITGTARRHLADSLRLRVGGQFLATDGRGVERLLEVETVDRREVVALVREETRRPPGPGANVTLAIAPPKGSRMETAVEKATEIGVGRILPILTARSVVKGRSDSERAERWARVAGSATAQSGRFHVPEILPVQTFDEAVAMTLMPAAGVPGRVLLAHLDFACVPLVEALAAGAAGSAAAGAGAATSAPASDSAPAVGGTAPAPPAPITIFIGPEGGFTNEEAERALAAGGQWVSLGPNRLRTETAAIAAVTLAIAAGFSMSSSSVDRA